VADGPTTTSTTREQQREFRRIIANAVGELRSQEVRDTYASIGLEELIDQQLDRLEGSSSSGNVDPVNPARLARIAKIKQDLDDNIAAMKATSPDEFRPHDPDNDANTAPDTEDEG